MGLTILAKKTTPEEIKDLYINKIWSLRKLARYFNLNRNTIKIYLAKHNIPIRTERVLLLDKLTTPKEMRQLYSDEKLSRAELARKFKLKTIDPVTNYLKRHNIPIRSQSEGYKIFNRKRRPSFLRDIDPQTLKLIEKLHWEDNQSLTKIIETLNLDISLRHFIRVLEVHNIPHRTNLETRRLRNVLGQDRRCSLNENFFSTWSSEMAYVLGWIYSDGCIDNGKRIRIATKDKYILENIRELLGSTHKLGFTKRTKVHHLEFISKKMYGDLVSYGLHPILLPIKKLVELS